jgi:GNAT superfamily N-acetyltransferase
MNKFQISTIPKGYVHQIIADLSILIHFTPLRGSAIDEVFERVFTGHSVLWGIFEPNTTRLVGFFVTTQKEYPGGARLCVDVMYTPKDVPEAATEAFEVLGSFQRDARCVGIETPQAKKLHEYYAGMIIGGCTYAIENLHTSYADAQRLTEMHFEEIAANKDVIKLNPDMDSYEEAEERHNLHIVTCRKEGILIGYHLSFIRPHLHYKDSLTAYTDLFFIHPEYRRGRVGLNLFKYAENTLWQRGVQRIYMPTKLKLDVGVLFERLGYSAIERVYTKVKP